MNFIEVTDCNFNIKKVVSTSIKKVRPFFTHEYKYIKGTQL